MNDEPTELALHRHFMARCHQLAATAREQGDAAVGSVVVQNGRVIGEGVERVRAGNDPTAHAEIEAVRAACQSLDSLDLNGCILYTSVEPCPMCAYAIRLARISVVVSDSPEPAAERSITGAMVLCAPDAVPNRGVPQLLRGMH